MGAELTIKGKLRSIDGKSSVQVSTFSLSAQGEICARAEMLAIRLVE